ncbi:MAG: AAA family ATPase [Candidatus Woesearchaeota archaeon]
MARSLVLGKFAPFHAGHASLIDRALELGEVTVLAYDTQVMPVPLNIRASRIRERYPSAEVIEAWGSPEREGYEPDIIAEHNDYIRTILGDRRIDFVIGSEPYVFDVARELDAEPMMIDPERMRIPISGTLIRSDPYRYRNYLGGQEYRDLVVNVVVMGGPSTGKSTLVEALAKHYATTFMHEHGRDYWLEHQVDRRLSIHALLELAQEHLEMENERLEHARDVFFTDTNAITTLLFSHQYYGIAKPELEALARTNRDRYDLFIVCDTDIPFDDTWERSGDGNRMLLQRMTLEYLRAHHIPYHVVRGSVEERVDAVARLLDRFKKWDPRTLAHDETRRNHEYRRHHQARVHHQGARTRVPR